MDDWVYLATAVTVFWKLIGFILYFISWQTLLYAFGGVSVLFLLLLVLSGVKEMLFGDEESETDNKAKAESESETDDKAETDDKSKADGELETADESEADSESARSDKCGSAVTNAVLLRKEASLSLADRLAKGVLSAGYGLGVDTLKKQAGNIFPFLAGLAGGQISVPEDFIQQQVNKKVAEIAPVEDVRIRCCDGHFDVTADCKEGPLKYSIHFIASVETFLVGKEKQIAEFTLSEDLDVESRNWASRISQTIAASLIDAVARSEETAALVSKKTRGVVDIAWPKVVLHLDAHPAIELANSLQVRNLGVWDLAEIVGCVVESGRVVLRISHKQIP